MAMSSTERTRLHRLRKKAEEFSNEYMNGANIATAKQFIKGKEHEACEKYQAAVIQFEAGMINEFYDLLKDHECEKNKYTIDSLIECWTEAHTSVQQ